MLSPGYSQGDYLFDPLLISKLSKLVVFYGNKLNKTHINGKPNFLIIENKVTVIDLIK